MIHRVDARVLGYQPGDLVDVDPDDPRVAGAVAAGLMESVEDQIAALPAYAPEDEDGPDVDGDAPDAGDGPPGGDPGPRGLDHAFDDHPTTTEPAEAPRRWPFG